MLRRAVLLAAGLGTRLRPLTNFLPKCLVPIRGRPLLEIWLGMLFSAGFERVLINTHYHAELVEEFIAGSPWSDRVVLSREKRLLGTAGTLKANAKFLEGEGFLVAHADNLTIFDPASFVQAHTTRPAAAAMTMMTFTTETPSSCGIVETDSSGLVRGFFEKYSNPPGNCANAAVYVFEPEVLHLIAGMEKAFVDLSTEVLPNYIGRIWTWHNSKYHRDIGNLESWRCAQCDFPVQSHAPIPDSWTALLEGRAKGAKAAVEALLQDKQ